MHFLTKILVLLAIVPTLALADANISADAGRKIDNSQTKSLKKDKSLSVDKSHGRRDSKSKSMERAIEGSDSTGHSTRTSAGHESQKSASVDVNINGLLLREFVRRYEFREPDAVGMTKSQLVFATCKPLTGIISEYPTLNSCPGATGSWAFDYKGPDLENIVARRTATHFTDCSADGGGGGGSSKGALGKDYLYMQKNPVNAKNEYVSRYARCRIVASKWVAEAAERAVSTSARSESDVHEHIQAAFAQMDEDPQLFEKFSSESKGIWRSANCSPWLSIYRDFQKPDIECGIFSIEGNAIEVQGRATLSEGSIEGRSYKIAISNSDSTGSSAEDSTAHDNRTSTASRRSDSSDTYDEGKKSATITKSKGLDDNETSDVNRGSGTHVSASPEK